MPIAYSFAYCSVGPRLGPILGDFGAPAFFLFVLGNEALLIERKRSGSPLTRRGWLEHHGRLLIAALVLYNVVDLLIPAAAAVPENVAERFPPILAAGLLVCLAVAAARLVKKCIRP